MHLRCLLRAISARTHFSKDRENHKDAVENYGRGLPAHAKARTGDYLLLHSARIVDQPADGHCLYHGLQHGLRKIGKQSADVHRLRQELAAFLLNNSHLTVSGNTLRQWVEWEHRGVSLEAYVHRIAITGWGGAVEMACCALSRGVNVHVYQRLPSGSYERLCCFDAENASHTVHMLYRGGVHYDSLELH